MPSPVRDLLLGQFDLAWALASYHLDGLTTEECLWRPAERGLHLVEQPGGVWRADWPDHEGYDLGPPSIGWVTWHICFWWEMVHDHGFGAATLTRDAVTWPGNADRVREVIAGYAATWRSALEGMGEAQLASAERTRWPFTGRPFADVAAWVNIELTKNAAEVGYARFLYALRR